MKFGILITFLSFAIGAATASDRFPPDKVKFLSLMQFLGAEKSSIAVSVVLMKESAEKAIYYRDFNYSTSNGTSYAIASETDLLPAQSMRSAIAVIEEFGLDSVSGREFTTKDVTLVIGMRDGTSREVYLFHDTHAKEIDRIREILLWPTAMKMAQKALVDLEERYEKKKKEALTLALEEMAKSVKK